jgi:hypothetical protein
MFRLIRVDYGIQVIYYEVKVAISFNKGVYLSLRRAGAIVVRGIFTGLNTDENL